MLTSGFTTDGGSFSIGNSLATFSMAAPYMCGTLKISTRTTRVGYSSWPISFAIASPFSHKDSAANESTGVFGSRDIIVIGYNDPEEAEPTTNPGPVISFFTKAISDYMKKGSPRGVFEVFATTYIWLTDMGKGKYTKITNSENEESITLGSVPGGIRASLEYETISLRASETYMTINSTSAFNKMLFFNTATGKLTQGIITPSTGAILVKEVSSENDYEYFVIGYNEDNVYLTKNSADPTKLIEFIALYTRITSSGSSFVQL